MIATSTCLKSMLLAGVIGSSIFASQAIAQPEPTQQPAATSTNKTVSAAADSSTKSPAASMRDQAADKAHAWHVREGGRYQRQWGVDIVGVRRISSGEMLEFRYRVLDVTKAKALNDKRSTAYMVDQATGTKLVVPQMEKVGLLRTTTTPQLNRIYWMVFANPGNLVKPGSLVNVAIGNFHVDGLVAQ